MCEQMTGYDVSHVAHMGTKRNEYKVLMGKSNRMRPLGKTKTEKGV